MNEMKNLSETEKINTAYFTFGKFFKEKGITRDEYKKILLEAYPNLKEDETEPTLKMLFD